MAGRDHGIRKKVEKFTKSKVLCYVTGDRQNQGIQIAQDAIDYVVHHLDTIGVTKNVSLVIYSRGGDLLAGWNIVNLIRQFCDELTVIVPMKAHSTATLIATWCLQALMMTKQATLGPIDPSVNGPLNPVAPGPNPMARVPVGVESVSGYFDFVKSLGVTSEAQIAQLVISLSQQLNPLVLGNVYRSRTQIRMLGKRLLSSHINNGKKVDKILDFLCSESGSHDYTINRREAANELGLKIRKPTDSQYAVIKALHDDYASELKLLTPYDPNVLLGQEPEIEYSVTRGLLESVDGGSTRFISRGKLRRLTMNGPAGPQEAMEDRRTFEAWHHED
ncbi:hypothetical protein UU5_17272 [Rhodanobacter sp. 115]|nr:hypothetical protein UU5_17272 [Rhodanobacter sp. 115]